MAHIETSTEYDKVQTSTSSGQGCCGDRVNAKNNTRNFMASTNKDYKGEIEAFGAVLAPKYE